MMLRNVSRYSLCPKGIIGNVNFGKQEETKKKLYGDNDIIRHPKTARFRQWYS